MAVALFETDGERFVPTELARGPWDRRAVHGGPIAALIARQMEALTSDRFFARITYDFLRPAPVTPITTEVTITQDGRSVTWLRARVSAEGRLVAEAAAVALRRRSHLPPLLSDDEVHEEAPPGPEAGTPGSDPVGGAYPAFHNRGMEVRFIRGSFVDQGPAIGWFRMAVPLIAGEEPSPLVRVAAAADFSNGVSTLVSWNEFTFINPDLTIYLHRDPVGEWIGLDAVTRAGPDATAVAESRLHDRKGPIGTTLQSVLLDPLGG